MPIPSATTAKIGTPSTNAANIRWISAAIHTAARLPISGKSRYALAVSAAAWTRRCSGIRHASCKPQKQVLRAFGAQDDMLARFARREKEERELNLYPPFLLCKGAARHVILSERAERALAKDLLVRSRYHWTRRRVSAWRNQSALRRGSRSAAPA